MLDPQAHCHLKIVRKRRPPTLVVSLPRSEDGRREWHRTESARRGKTGAHHARHRAAAGQHCAKSAKQAVAHSLGYGTGVETLSPWRRQRRVESEAEQRMKRDTGTGRRSVQLAPMLWLCQRDCASGRRGTQQEKEQALSTEPRCRRGPGEAAGRGGWPGWRVQGAAGRPVRATVRKRSEGGAEVEGARARARPFPSVDSAMAIAPRARPRLPRLAEPQADLQYHTEPLESVQGTRVFPPALLSSRELVEKDEAPDTCSKKSPSPPRLRSCIRLHRLNPRIRRQHAQHGLHEAPSLLSAGVPRKLTAHAHRSHGAAGGQARGGKRGMHGCRAHGRVRAAWRGVVGAARRGSPRPRSAAALASHPASTRPRLPRNHERRLPGLDHADSFRCPHPLGPSPPVRVGPPRRRAQARGRVRSQEQARDLEDRPHPLQDPPCCS